MLRYMEIAAVLLLGALNGITQAQAQSFSADLVMINADGGDGKSGKVLVESGKVRIDAPELPQGFFILEPSLKVSYFVRPSQFVFMDAKQSSQLTQLLVPADPDAPCVQWQMMAKVADISDSSPAWRCERLGDEVLDGRATFKYRAVSPKGASITAWIDPELKFLLRFRNQDGSGIDIKTIELGPQDKRLFEIPADYDKFDPKELIERVKQSDVWIEPPKAAPRTDE
jgi:hypothetical protein